MPKRYLLTVINGEREAQRRVWLLFIGRFLPKPSTDISCEACQFCDAGFCFRYLRETDLRAGACSEFVPSPGTIRRLKVVKRFELMKVYDEQNKKRRRRKNGTATG